MPKKARTSISEYQRKRDFRKTPEPRGAARRGTGHVFVIQKHAASRLHYDLRLEMNGVLKSWAIPKGPSLNPADKRLAVHVEDHPLEYAEFEGTIPKGQYGGGTVLLWDRGRWKPRGNGLRDYERGRLKFELDGEKLHGGWSLVRMGNKSDDNSRNWLLVKEKDDEADRDANVTEDEPLSVLSGRTVEEISKDRDRTWQGNGAAKATRPSKNSGGRKARRAKSTKGAGEPDPSQISGARKARLPAKMSPQLATLVPTVPEGDDWLHELKFDGYRLLAFIDDGKVKLITRRGQNWTSKFRKIAQAMAELPVKQAILDGEVVVQNPDGTTDFQALQNVLDGTRDDDLLYYSFDLPYCNGYDLTHAPLSERKEVLRQIVSAQDDAAPIRFSDHIQGEGREVFANACRFALEGIISKRADSHYVQRRTATWTKSKCLHRQEFVIGGFTDPSGARTGFGALLVGYFDKDAKLVYCGRVGTGFNEKTLSSLHARLRRKESDEPAFSNPPQGREARGVHWVEPELVAEVEFGSWTRSHVLRHPSFQGLRLDKKAKEVTLEKPQPVSKGKSKPSASARRSKRHSKTTRSRRRNSHAAEQKSRVAGVALTNPDRVLYPEQKVTKLELAHFYESIQDWILPHVVKRPLSLVRCPRGHTGDCFFQKHLKEIAGDAIQKVAIKEKSGTRDYVSISDLSGLVALVQIGVLEIHPWGCRTDNVERPDRLVFDLDPAPGVAWAHVIDAAKLLRHRLEELELQSFVKATGGKGLHVVAPIQRRIGWDDLKAFAKAIAEGLVREQPDKYISTASKSKRKGKIFIDYLRNGRGATSIAAYSTRARAGAPVATPLRWDELTAATGPADFTVENLPTRMKKLKKDPWNDFFRVRQSITAAARRKVGA